MGEQTFALLFIERDQAAEQVAELLDMVGDVEPQTVPVVIPGKPVMRLSATGLTDQIKTLLAAS